MYSKRNKCLITVFVAMFLTGCGTINAIMEGATQALENATAENSSFYSNEYITHFDFEEGEAGDPLFSDGLNGSETQAKQSSLWKTIEESRRDAVTLARSSSSLKSTPIADVAKGRACMIAKMQLI